MDVGCIAYWTYLDYIDLGYGLLHPHRALALRQLSFLLVLEIVR